jgi:predicted unusual protein kinase regulating ubiquinone biosynthesis (AarF/ABC1/UbiB family)
MGWGWLTILWSLGHYAVGAIGYVALVKKVCRELARLNIFYVKLFQWWSPAGDTRDPYLELPEFFETFRTDVPYTDGDLANAPSLPGLTLERKPIGSGTLAVVFRGRYEGRPVAVKLLRPGVKQQLTDLFWQIGVFRGVVRFLPFRSFRRVSRLARLLEEDLRATFEGQVDFLQEAANMRRFQAAFRQNRSICIPECYFATEEVLIMDYFTSFPERDWAAPDYQAYSRLFSHFLVACYFIKDLYHGDLHLGNMIFLKTGDGAHRLGIIDFGLVGGLNVPSQNFILQVLHSFAQKDLPGFLGHYVDYITPVDGERQWVLAHFRAVFARKAITTLPTDTAGLTGLIRFMYMEMLDLNLNRFALDPNLNIYLFSVLALIETLNVLTLNDTRNHLFDLFDLFGKFEEFDPFS